MSILLKLSSSSKRKDELLNVELANMIVAQNDRIAIQELVDNLGNEDKRIQNDCIKVLYEIGSQNSSLIQEYLEVFLTLLKSKNNRLQWGSMTALNTITLSAPRLVYNALGEIIQAADQGSVITKDNAVNILIKLCSLPEYKDNVFPLFIEQLLKCPVNQLPMYAERAVSIVYSENKTVFINTLLTRLDEIEKESKQKRILKVIKKVE